MTNDWCYSEVSWGQRWKGTEGEGEKRAKGREKGKEKKREMLHLVICEWSLLHDIGNTKRKKRIEHVQEWYTCRSIVLSLSE